MKQTLSERQLAVLEWVGTGCPEGASATYKTSCQALQNRGLVTVARRGGVWNAVLTDAGRHYLAHGTYPAPKAPVRALPIRRLPKATAPRPSPGVPQQPRKTYTDQLLEELEAAGGRILKSGPDADAWWSRAASALCRWHRGRDNAASPPPPAHPHFTIKAQGQTVEFRVLQEKDRSEHIATDKELGEAKKSPWIRIPRYDYTPSERLRIALSGGQWHHGSEWVDSAERPLEEQLAEIVHEIGLRGEAAERKRLADLEQARQKRLRREAAMAEARDQYAEDYRVRQLESQEAAWRRATRLGDYLEAARAHVATLPPGPERTAAEEWMQWATEHVARAHPMFQQLRLPEIPEPRTDDLKPFLRGWSPYGAY
ncbi:hypothetical protein OOK31_18025 [Streptomyces sp. NBC_00249]|uniref:hypothetical protein n=1 Tax=Streptomyces sp. NBC_00249 TaxID=2975690 RepID=UPI002254846D|nr:hypothetical protein [Streptomyces sp. NBC_00249]MCX5195769.1 hypothetical protein [Streptomyces sp. NBC_00249]